MKKWPTPNRVTLLTKGAEKKANNLGTFLQNIPIVKLRNTNCMVVWYFWGSIPINIVLCEAESECTVSIEIRLQLLFIHSMNVYASRT